MIDYSEKIRNMEKELKQNLSKKRLVHTMNVLEESLKLAKEYGVDQNKTAFTALAHDRFRDISDEELDKMIIKYGIDKRYMDNNDLAHGRVTAAYVEDKYKIKDDDILNALIYHTTGRKGMSLLEKIVFLADKIEKDRDYPGIEHIRNEAEKSLNKGIRVCLIDTVEYLNVTKKDIDKDTLDALEYMNSEEE